MHLFEPMHFLIILAIVLVLFGGKKIPELMRGVGQGLGELQKGVADSKRMMNQAMEDVKIEEKPATAATPAAPVSPVAPSSTVPHS